MSPPDLLQLIVEASLALAGFAGVVVAVAKGGTHALSSLQRLSLVNLLATSFGALFISLLALGMLAAAIDPAIIWKTASAIGLLVLIYFGTRSARTVIGEVGATVQSVSTLLVIEIPLAGVCIVQGWNIAVAGSFWPVFLLLCAFFALACYSFVRILFLDEA